MGLIWKYGSKHAKGPPVKASHEYYPHQEDIFEVSTVVYDTYIPKWPWTTPTSVKGLQ